MYQFETGNLTEKRKKQGKGWVGGGGVKVFAE